MLQSDAPAEYFSLSFFEMEKRYLFAITLVLVTVSGLAINVNRGPPAKRARLEKKAKKIAEDTFLCNVNDFDCSESSLKNCKRSPNYKTLKQYCFSLNDHEKLMGHLEDIYNGNDELKSRSKRRLEQLDDGFTSFSEVDAAGSCSIGGGTITTFDGYSHTLTGGPCTYVLAVDRTISKLVVYGTFVSQDGGKFANKLINVALYMGADTLVLGQGYDINYQGLGYDTPAIINDKLVVWRDGQYIYAEAKALHAHIRWDPLGQLKIAVGAQYANETLGLCGLFNNDASLEHNTITYNYGSNDLTANDFSTQWALSGCYHEDAGRLAERMRNCDTYLYTRLCSVTHAAPDLISCIRDETLAMRYQEECVQNLCLCDDLDECMYAESLRISNDCLDRIGVSIDNGALREYLDQGYIQAAIPQNYAEVPTTSEELGNLKNFGQPYEYQDFMPAGSCYVYGHSYVHTFDNTAYRTGAHGCTYPLSLKEGIQHYTIYGTFAAEQPTGALASSLVYVSFFDLKNRVRVQLGQGLEVNYEGSAVQLPYHREFVSIWYDSDQHHIYVYDHDLGLELRWDGEAALRITLDARYQGETKGLCGTFNADSTDEINLLKETVVMPSDYQIMVQAWELPTCSHKVSDYNPVDFCLPSLQDYTSCKQALTNVKFSYCVTELPPIHFIERCEQDLCRCADDEACKCDVVSAYAQMCQDVINHSLDWRSDEFCPRNLCLYNKNGCLHKCNAPGVCSCDDGFELGADGKSCLVIIAE